jgi:hypothetical protein
MTRERKAAISLLLIPLLLALMGCPPPRHVEVFNNTPDDVWIMTGVRNTFIKAGGTKTLTENDFIHHSSSEDRRYPAFIWIQSRGQRTRQYSITREDLPRIRPRQDVMSRVQIQPEGSLIFLDRDSRYSAYGSAEEPPGISIKGHLGL